ncbi:MAG: hypothetical protein E6G52_09340 [Actinobacteria bacterium]|nr:MAG: hypothetical protein E6G52_09340 [Actinomycetota bacterium]
MRSLVRRSLVAAAVGSGVILAGFTGLTHASAASSSNMASTKATTSASATHHCDGDGNDSTSDGSSTST